MKLHLITVLGSALLLAMYLKGCASSQKPLLEVNVPSNVASGLQAAGVKINTQAQPTNTGSNVQIAPAPISAPQDSENFRDKRPYHHDRREHD